MDSQNSETGIVVWLNKEKIFEKTAVDTFVETLKRVGLKKVSTFDKEFRGYKLVGRKQRLDGNKQWQKLIDGWYVYTNICNKDKTKTLEQLADALHIDLMVQNLAENPLDENMPTKNTHVEGGKTNKESSTYERDESARKECLKYYGYKCQVCGIELEEKYGIYGRKFLEVHHIVPISKQGGEYELDPIKDLRPLCPNCHAMIHRTGKQGSDEIMYIFRSIPVQYSGVVVSSQKG